MMDDMEQMIKEKLLEELIAKMSDTGADRIKPKSLGVEVQAPDKEHLAEGLDKAKSLLSKSDLPPEADSEASADSDQDDEQRLLALLDNDDEEDEGR